MQLQNLRMIYLHGNNIIRLGEIDKLGGLPHLKSLSLHGNPIESNAGYRYYVLSRIPQLQTMDFSGVTNGDRRSAETWSRMTGSKKSPKHKSPSSPAT